MTEERVEYQVSGKRRHRLIEIRLPGCVVFLKEEEVTRLLALDPTLWEQAIRGGKGILRHRQHAARNQAKLPARCKDRLPQP